MSSLTEFYLSPFETVSPVQLFEKYCDTLNGRYFTVIYYIFLRHTFFFTIQAQVCIPSVNRRILLARIRPALMTDRNGISFVPSSSSPQITRIAKLSGRSIMAKSFVYFSAGVSGESRPSLVLARDGRHGLCRNAVALCNIVYEKDPANAAHRGSTCCLLLLRPPSSIHRRAKKTGRPRDYETCLIT